MCYNACVNTFISDKYLQLLLMLFKVLLNAHLAMYSQLKNICTTAETMLLKCQKNLHLINVNKVIRKIEKKYTTINY